MTLGFSDVNFDITKGVETGGTTPEGFLPAGTTITVEADGSGDFETIADAVNFLTGKWSNGAVTIELGTGTFNISNPIIINTDTMNIKRVNIIGKGTSNTIINTSVSGDWPLSARAFSGYTYFSDFKVTGSGASHYGIHALSSNVKIDACLFENLEIAVLSERLSLTDTNNLSFKNITAQALRASDADIEVRGTQTFNTVGTCFHVLRGGIIRGRAFTGSYTSVTNKTNQTVGSATSTGWITGDTY